MIFMSPLEPKVSEWPDKIDTLPPSPSPLPALILTLPPDPIIPLPATTFTLPPFDAEDPDKVIEPPVVTVEDAMESPLFTRISDPYAEFVRPAMSLTLPESISLSPLENTKLPDPDTVEDPEEI
jgi:hypothetical protein